MNMTLREEIKQEKPFKSAGHEAYLQLVRTSALLQHAFAETLKPYGITTTQYNVLRILRGAGSSGLCRHEIRDRMLTPVPDVTRLLDRLEAEGLATRERGEEDRRLVTSRITSEGLAVLRRLEGPMDATHDRHIGHMSERDLRQLSDLLQEARSTLVK